MLGRQVSCWGVIEYVGEASKLSGRHHSMTYRNSPAGQKQGIDALCGRLWAGVTRCFRTVYIDEDTWKF